MKRALALLLAAALILPVPATTLAADELGGSLISMEFDNAPLKDVLKILSEQSGLNFVASQDVESRKVTVFLENVPIDDALDGIMSANNLRYEKKKGVFVVFPSVESAESAAGPGASPGGLQTRIFKLKYTRLSISPMDVGGKSVIDDLPSPEVVSVVKSADDAEKKDEDKEEKTNLMAERGADKIVSSLLSEFGKVAVDVNTNSLIVTDSPQKLQEIEKVLQKIDVPAQQVMLEVQMMEVRKGLLEDHGVDWGGTNGRLLSFSGPRQSTSFPFFEGPFRGNQATNIIDPITNTTNIPDVNDDGDVLGNFGGRPSIELGVLSAQELSAVLRLITSQSDTKVLARPRVLALNNEAANFKLVTKTVVGVKSTLVTSQSLTTFTVGEAVTADTGITLKITPQVNEDSTVGLFLQPSITTVAASNFFPDDFLEPTTRTVRTTVRVKDHQTLVLAGIVDNDVIVTNRKIPGLGDLPLLGNAFKYKSSNEKNREFLIFITPHIVRHYDSLAADSATADGRDLAVKRMLDSFQENELNMHLDPLEVRMRSALPIEHDEKKLIEDAARKALTPKMESEMNSSLDAFAPSPAERR
ncbi:MAG: Type IV pilus biogenesis and competence protein PilQ [Candidatus Omnitrophica bacterium]|nr:Type IV pilus biogenesis and competence protein PilQ [Candidatus Omnitrophota bacterium]